MQKCDICKQHIKKYIWHNVPVNGTYFENVCDRCALYYTKVFIEENSPEYSREATSHFKEYEEVNSLLRTIKEEV